MFNEQPNILMSSGQPEPDQTANYSPADLVSCCPRRVSSEFFYAAKG